MIIVPSIYWPVVSGMLASRRHEAAYKLLEQRNNPSAVGIPNQTNMTQRESERVAFAHSNTTPGLLAPHPPAALSHASAPPIERAKSVSALAGGDKESVTCIVCYESPRTTCFTPCGHVACCKTCASLIVDGLCPICRQKFAAVVELHIS